ncbi:hypothetical protein PR003_g19577 [Phytophthora rubi]|uniref:Uncharacterized protein n=1 Tax=Phytophthora rubi TaxID=129364 RepID=A0A6A3IY36_9STRA|nr:hypothetical protein PR002_g21885 [Phytophthora rubi]KAE9313135.1 hypothetical protein PR003_g19577 [Phytophthora rubi]
MEPYEETGYYDNEEVYETEPPREERSLYGPSAYQGYGGVYYTGPGYGSYGDYGGYSQPLEYEGYGKPTRSLDTIGGLAASSRGTRDPRREGSSGLLSAGDLYRPGRYDLRCQGCMGPFLDDENSTAWRRCPEERLLRPPRAGQFRRAFPR